MTIEKNKVVAFQYVLKNEAGEEVERTGVDDPIVYLHGGHQNLLPRLEEALEGKDKGDQVVVTLPPEHAYGMHLENTVHRIPKKHLLTREKRLKPGMPIKVNTAEGPRDVMIVKVGKFNIDADTNHPLAGMTITFETTILDIRDATPEEITPGHSPGWDASEHHH